MFDLKEIYEPDSLEEALQIFRDHPSAKIIAGGTDVLIKIRDDAWDEIELLSLDKIDELRNIKINGDGEISIGAMVSFNGVMSNPIIKDKLPMLSHAASTMGGPQIRNMATFGGNLANGVVSADSAPMLMALDASVKILSFANESAGSITDASSRTGTNLNTSSRTGTNLASERIVPLTEFYLGPGKVVLQPGEILTEILIPKSSLVGLSGYYYKYAVRNAMDIANLSIAAVFKLDDDGIINDMRISLGVAAPTPIRCKEAEDFAIGKPMNQETLEKAGDLAVGCSKARDSWRASKEYREHLIVVLLKECCKLAINDTSKAVKL